MLWTLQKAFCTWCGLQNFVEFGVRTWVNGFLILHAAKQTITSVALGWNVWLGHKNICFGYCDQLTCKNHQRDALFSCTCARSRVILSFATFGVTFVCVLRFPTVLVCLPLLSCPWHSLIFHSLFHPCWEVLAEVDFDSIFLHLHKVVIEFLVIKVCSK